MVVNSRCLRREFDAKSQPQFFDRVTSRLLVAWSEVMKDTRVSLGDISGKGNGNRPWRPITLDM
jgi:hypothetical protein